MMQSPNTALSTDKLNISYAQIILDADASTLSQKFNNCKAYYSDKQELLRARAEPQLGAMANENLDNLQEHQTRATKSEQRMF